MSPVRRTPALFVLSTGLAALPAQVAFHDPDGRALVAADAEVETLAACLRYADGPVWVASAHKLVFTDSGAGKLLQWTADQGVTFVADCESGGGNALDPQGRLVSCQLLSRNLVLRDVDLTPIVLVCRYDGKRFNSPGDLAVRKDGTLWFTDPDYGLAGRRREQEGNRVYRFDPVSRSVWVVQCDFDEPDGICFAPDHERIYIADSGRRHRIGAFPVEAGGTLGAALFWIDGAANGLRCDVQGNLYAAAQDGIRIFSPDGRHLVTVSFPQVPNHCAFGGIDRTELFVTAGPLLCRVAVRVPGAPLPPFEPAAGGIGSAPYVR
ncbi:MAG TPA: SMP-30/gluconolactonase/LRE family protein [Planctomycetota bacterium]|nr:SMP-30/gluconolactonase/LRE family protein [Planctomycetota bacterium]